MKIPIGIIARFALRIVARAVADGKNPLTKEGAKAALEKAITDEAMRRIGKVR